MSGLVFQELESQFTTPIPDAFITDFMPGANGNYVKVYLCAYYGYFHRVRGLTMSKIARKLHMLESEVIEALKYWHDAGVLSFIYHEESDQYLLTFTMTKDPQPVKSAPVPSKAPSFEGKPRKEAVVEVKPRKEPLQQKVIRVEQPPNYSADELAIYSKQPECSELFSFAANLLGAPLSSVNASKVLSFLDFYRLPMPVIKYMMEYAVKNGHRSLRYIEKIALDWSENGIATIEEAEEYVNRYAIYWPLMRAYNQSGSVPDEALREYAAKWVNDLGMSEELIVEACKRTMEQLHKASYPYTNSILENWKKENVSTLFDVARLDEEHASTLRPAASQAGQNRSLNNFSSRGEDLDYDALAKESMERLYAIYGDADSRKEDE